MYVHSDVPFAFSIFKNVQGPIPSLLDAVGIIIWSGIYMQRIVQFTIKERTASEATLQTCLQWYTTVWRKAVHSCHQHMLAMAGAVSSCKFFMYIAYKSCSQGAVIFVHLCQWFLHKFLDECDFLCCVLWSHKVWSK